MTPAASRDPSPPLVLLRAGGGVAEAWVVTGAPLHPAAAAALAAGVGPVGLALDVAGWQRAGVVDLTFDLAPDDLPPGEAPDAAALQAGVERLLREGGPPPPWLTPLCTRPGGDRLHWTPTEVAAALCGGVGQGAAALRRLPLTALDEPGGRAEARALAAAMGLPLVDLFARCIALRDAARPRLVALPDAARLPTPHGVFTMHLFESPWTGAQHVAMVMGEVARGGPVLIRAHSECFTGDIMGSLRCDCGPQLDAALARIAREGRGVLLYLRQEGRGIGLYGKMQAYIAQDQGLDTVEANHAVGFPADLRSYQEAADMLRALGISAVRVLTNNPLKLEALARCGVDVVGREAHVVGANPENLGYLETKRVRMGHLLRPMGG